MHQILSTIATSLLVLFVSSAHAERVGKILYYNASQSAPKEAFIYVNGEAFAQQELPRWHFSPAMEVKSGDLVMTFTPSAVVDGNEIPANAPKVRIPADWEKFLLLVTPNPKNKYFPILVKAINASSNAFKGGEIYFVNFSNGTVFGHIGDKKLRLLPGKKKILSSGSTTGSGDCVVKLDYFIKRQSKAKRFVRQTWSHNSKIRQMVFILPKETGGLSYYSTLIRDL